jgi:hypothetical protein
MSQTLTSVAFSRAEDESDKTAKPQALRLASEPPRVDRGASWIWDHDGRFERQLTNRRPVASQ